MPMEIWETIQSLIRQAKPLSAPLQQEAHLYWDLDFDSLAFVQLLLQIEQCFSISIALIEMEDCLQLDRLLALVEEKTKEGQA